jgi:glutathione S-transferase
LGSGGADPQAAKTVATAIDARTRADLMTKPSIPLYRILPFRLSIRRATGSMNSPTTFGSLCRRIHTTKMPETHKLKLISFDLCPYVERSRIVLEEKKVPYEIEFVDLKNKPAWFLEISPRGKVPVLVVDGTPIFESMVINEMLEELYPEPPMFPKTPVDRAQARAWIVFCNDVIMVPSFELAMAKTEEARSALRTTLGNAFARLETQLQKSAGKFFFGDAFGLVDAVFAPFFVRFKTTAELVGGISFEKYATVQKYSDALLAHPSAQKARAENLIERHRAMLKERMIGTSGY